MNFLVTGGAGFIGSHVCERLLHDGHNVWAFDDLNHFYDPQFKQRNLRAIQSLAKPFEFVHGDITDASALADFFLGQVRPGHPPRRARGRAAQPRRTGALPARQRRGHGQRARSRTQNRREKNHHRVLVVGLWLNSKVPFAESDPVVLRHLALRREQAGVRGARPRLASHLQNGRGDAALFHRLRPAPAARPGDL
jgi:hypothetical protein